VSSQTPDAIPQSRNRGLGFARCSQSLAFDTIHRRELPGVDNECFELKALRRE